MTEEKGGSEGRGGERHCGVGRGQADTDRKTVARVIRQVGGRENISHRWEKDGSSVAQAEGGRQKWEQGLRVRWGRRRGPW